MSSEKDQCQQENFQSHSKQGKGYLERMLKENMRLSSFWDFKLAKYKDEKVVLPESNNATTRIQHQGTKNWFTEVVKDYERKTLEDSKVS